MTKKATVPGRMLSKAVGVFSIAPLFVLAIFVLMRALEPGYALYAACAIVAATTVVVRPYLTNIVALTRYVYDLSRDRRAEAPDLSFLATENELSDAIMHLHRALEKKRQQLEAMLFEREILVDTLPDALIMIDSEEQILRTNSAARHQFGQNLAHKKIGAIIKNITLQQAISKALATGEGQSVELYMAGEAEKYYRARLERFPVHSPGGISLIVTLHDITELKIIEQMRADFVANASHEIKTPLASLVGFIETLRGPAKDDPDAREKFLSIMADQATRMTKLVNDLLSLSKIEMNAHTEPQGRIDLRELLLGEIRQAEWSAQKRGAKIVAEIPEHLPSLPGDAAEMSQVFRNLIENALKYGKEESTVTVRVEPFSQLPPESGVAHPVPGLVASVQDEGDGIAKEHIPRLTERFYRVDKARSRKEGGTGLGLAIVKHILNRHRAYLKIESEPGKGSVFSVYLPLNRTQAMPGG